MPKLKPGTILVTPEEDEEITRAAMDDPDCIPYTDEEWAKVRIYRQVLYPAQFKSDRQTGAYVVTFRDFPEVVVQGADEADALNLAEEALIACLTACFEQGRAVPARSLQRHDERMVYLRADVDPALLSYLGLDD